MCEDGIAEHREVATISESLTLPRIAVVAVFLVAGCAGPQWILWTDPPRGGTPTPIREFNARWACEYVRIFAPGPLTPRLVCLPDGDTPAER
jgi:hypothetical protein